MAPSTKSRTSSKKAAKKASTSSRKRSSSGSSSGSSSSSLSSSSSAKRAPRALSQGDVANERAAAGHKNAGVQGGFVDQMTRRSGNDALEGHFVHVDHTASGLSKEAKERLDGRTGYGVYISPAETDADGSPVTANVQLRDRSNAVVTVPYAALSPVDPTDRRP